MKFKSKKAMAKALMKGRTFINYLGGRIYYDDTKCNPFRDDETGMVSIWEDYKQDIWTEEVKVKFDLFSILEVDTPVMVRDGLTDKWLPRLYSQNKRTHTDGKDSFTNTHKNTIFWNHFRLPTPQEAPLNTKIPYHHSLGKPDDIDGMKVLVWTENNRNYPISNEYGCFNLDWNRCTNPITHYMILEK